MTEISNNIAYCAESILKGELVSFPTETVYGLGANIFNDEAIEKIFYYKERPNDNPLIVHIYNINQLNEITNLDKEQMNLVRKITDVFWPGPLTLILPKSNKVSKLVTANTDYVGVRMPANEKALELLKKCNVPIAAPSANKYCHVSATNYQHVLKEFKDKKLIVIPNETEILDIGIESSIFKLDFKNRNLILLRPGFINPNMLLKLLPEYKLVCNFEENNTPGSKKKHYSINKETFLLKDRDRININFNKEKVSFLDFGNKFKSYGFKNYYTLSSGNDFYVAMQNLYSILHLIESNDTEILIIYFPEENDPCYEALYNRLIRCCSGNLISCNKFTKLDL